MIQALRNLYFQNITSYNKYICKYMYIYIYIYIYIKIISKTKLGSTDLFPVFSL